ncbi:MAG: hypothetical protein FD165_1303 [Gammaproteobacteria bacterium]|nr:MAG: hypothetical protein FD165_1303 [Gammaproteobacteria bacterium]TND05802.1 MAG: hypothetical protein FD120_1015 [Gammaproteobacteria bacterium]
MEQPHYRLTKLPDDVLRALVSGRKLEAIALLRDISYLSPVDARREIEDFIKHNPELFGVQGALEYNISRHLMLIVIVLLMVLLLVFV